MYSKTETLTVQAIKTREGKTKQGKPYQSVSICDQDDRWLSSFAENSDDPVLRLEKGDKIEAEVWKKGDYWNFKLVPTDQRDEKQAPEQAPDGFDVMLALERIDGKLERVLKAVEKEPELDF